MTSSDSSDDGSSGAHESSSGSETGSTGDASTDESSGSSGGAPVVPHCSDGVVDVGDVCFADGIDLAAAYDLDSLEFRTRPGHFDDDDHLDLAVLGIAPEASDGVQILLGDGAGGFVVAEQYLAISDIYDFDVDDFDGDGLDDVVLRGQGVMVPEHPSFFVALNRGIDGWEITDASHDDGFVGMVGAFDYDGDGHSDVVTYVNGDDARLRIYPGDGSGHVGEPAFDFAMPDAASIGELDIADVTGDGNPDILIDHDGFSTWGYVYAGATGGPAGAYFPFMFSDEGTALADVDGNGSLDAVTTRYLSFEILRNDGDGTFTPMATLDASDEVTGVAAADFDQDGHVDAVVGDRLTATLYRGLGDYAFEAVGEVALGDEFFRNNMRLGDFNEDGVPDIVVDNQGQAVLLLSDP